MRKGIRFFRGVVANVAIVAVAGALLAFASSGAAVSVGTGKSPVYKGEAKDKVSLMINVYWGTEYIRGMLDVLDANGVKTTFFVGGSWVRDNEEVFTEIVARGHEIGNHGFFHKDHARLGEKGNREEIKATHSLIKALTGMEMRLFAPPSGSFGDVTLAVAEEMGYTTIMWSKDTIDWRDKDSKLIFSRMTKNIAGGDLVLMHPTAATAAVLDSAIKAIAEKGLTVAPVSEVIGQREDLHERDT